MYSAFISAAEGKRDSYQFPLALAQANILERHVTDIYTPDYLKKYFSYFKNNAISKKFLSRNHSLLSFEKIYSSKRLLSYLLIKYLFLKKVNIFHNFNQNILSKVVLELANKHDAGMFLYAGYAFYAFTNDKSNDRPRGLIQYHPHIGQSSKILLEDLEKYKYFTNAYEQIKQDMKDPTNIIELELSDKIICHSKFTEESVKKAGIPQEKIITFPYGINTNNIIFESKNQLTKPKEKCNFLFVGQGVHRKGLHHLLMAWKKANLKFSNLNIVSRYIDPEIKINAKMCDNINFLQNIDNNKKISIFKKNDIFVMPSIIEGFGYVYLEALSHGLFCIGTKNTGLKDISSKKTSRILDSGDIKNLSLRLKELEDIVITKGIDREMIKSSIKDFTWKNYREKVSETCKKVLLK